MKLTDIDWMTITRKQAAQLRPAARRREQALGVQYEAGQIDEAEFIAAAQLEEDLQVYALCGEKPAVQVAS